MLFSTMYLSLLHSQNALQVGSNILTIILSFSVAVIE